MKLSVFGLGYVGVVAAGCLAADGHETIGVDPNREKVDLVNDGNSPIIEKDIGEMVEAAVREGTLRATTDAGEAVMASDMALICVGTPSQRNGSLDLTYVRRVCEEIGQAIAKKDDYFVVVIRSTILPGTMKGLIVPVLEEASGKKAGVDFGVCNNPEFLREGTAVYDYRNPPKTVIGELDERSGAMLAELYADLDAPLIRTSVEVAETVKYIDNVWHATKVAFANEVGAVCKSLDIDSHKVMDIFCLDTKLNLSSYYMRPGFAFGGSCLPKDVRAFNYRANSLDLDLPLIGSIMGSNERHIDRGFELVTRNGKKKVGVLGFSFKAGTDDLRESPIVELIERLLGKGYELDLYDRNVSIAALKGGNRDYILNHIPHISRLMRDSAEEVIGNCDTIIIGNSDPAFADLTFRDDQTIVDLVRIGGGASAVEGYEGICW
ncbi:nucleotide sugar dehydrogenase [Qipengyuania aquimaris]|uniref:nucleotide sugar dehydrogenase n=1 Tax=Qipengyuania aquimaris TaxID=255984 RepID=UPI001CD7B45E|nr:nucleotide sugar dehydrogenase [Qipengyuania aquimaris]MCA0902374.1 nucleotide sugar dehydrogenase [Qipengyuania aquimaris]